MINLTVKVFLVTIINIKIKGDHFMKKMILSTAALLTLFSLAACSNKQETKKETSNSQTTSKVTSKSSGTSKSCLQN